MTAGVNLVPPGIAYATVLATLHAQCFDDAWSPQAVKEVLASPGAFAFLALADGTGAEDPGPVGFAIARIAGDDMELLSLGVVSRCRRHGVARALVEAVLRSAREAGARTAFLEVAETNEAARILYAACGFAAVGRRPDYYRRPNAVPIAALTLRAELSATAGRHDTGAAQRES